MKLFTDAVLFVIALICCVIIGIPMTIFSLFRPSKRLTIDECVDAGLAERRAYNNLPSFAHRWTEWRVRRRT